MDKSLMGHSVAAVAAAALGFAAWAAPKLDKDNSPIMIAGDATKLSRIAWHEEGYDVTVARDGEAVSVTVQKIAKEGEPAMPAKTFPGTKDAEELFGKLAPLKAGRALGVLNEDKQKTMGLTAPKSSLNLSFGSDEKKVEIGDAAYGTGDLYGRINGEVYLIPAATLSGLRHGANSLVDRSLVGIKEDKIKRLTITGGDNGREVVQRFGEDRAKAFYADPAEPETKLETVANWLNRLYRLRVAEQVTDQPEGNPAIEVELFGDKDSLGLVKLWNMGDKTVLATSTRFKSAVTVSKTDVDVLLKDLDAALNEGK